MVSGKLKCIGSCQHLKEKFGGTYQLDIRCNDTNSDVVIDLIGNQIPGVFVEEAHCGHIRIRLPGDVDLANAFDMLEKAKQESDILDYSLSQATLEQIFINFAKEQEEERGHVGGMSYSHSGT
jgi:hypothetical protein